MNNSSFIGSKDNIHPNGKSLIVLNGNIPGIAKAVSDIEITGNAMVYDKSENIQRSTYHNYNDTYNIPNNVDAGNTMIAYRSEDKADSTIDCDIKKNISINEERKETEMKKR